MHSPFKSFSWINFLSVAMILLAIGLWAGLPMMPLTAVGQTTDDEESTTSDEAEEEDENHICVLEVSDFMIPAEATLLEKLQSIFAKEKYNSALLEEAMAEYETFQTDTEDLFTQYSVVDPHQTNEDLNEEIDACNYYIANHYKTVEALIEVHNLRTSAGKTSYVLVEKLQDINEGLREMNIGFGQIYDGFQTLASKLPGTIE